MGEAESESESETLWSWGRIADVTSAEVHPEPWIVTSRRISYYKYDLTCMGIGMLSRDGVLFFLIYVQWFVFRGKYMYYA